MLPSLLQSTPRTESVAVVILIIELLEVTSKTASFFVVFAQLANKYDEFGLKARA